MRNGYAHVTAIGVSTWLPYFRADWRIAGTGLLIAFSAVTHGHQAVPPALAASAAVEQTSHGSRPPLAVLESFDGIGHGLDTPGTNGAPLPRNPSDNSLAVGPDHVFQIVN